MSDPIEIANLTVAEIESTACMADRHMWYYFLVSISTLAFAIILVLVPRMLSAPCRSKVRLKMAITRPALSQF